MSQQDPHVPPGAAEDGLAAFILSMADYCGFQPDGLGGGFDLWTLRKSLRGHCVGSTVTRATLEKAWKAGHYTAAHKYGKTTVDADDPSLKVVE